MKQLRLPGRLTNLALTSYNSPKNENKDGRYCRERTIKNDRKALPYSTCRKLGRVDGLCASHAGICPTGAGTSRAACTTCVSGTGQDDPTFDGELHERQAVFP